MGTSGMFQSHMWDQAHIEVQKEKAQTKSTNKKKNPQQNGNNQKDNTERETGTSPVQQHKNNVTLLWRKRTLCVREKWVMKKGMQMAQGLNDEATAEVCESVVKNANSDVKKEQHVKGNNDTKQVHWSRMQSQGCQTHTHVQLCQEKDIT